MRRLRTTGGVELHCPIGSLPRLVGPLTGPFVEVLAPGTTVIGVRFHPGVAAPMLGLPASELVDLTLHLDEIWGPAAVVLGELVSGARSPEVALFILQEELVGRRADGTQPDPLVSEAVRRLMPWRAGEIGSLSSLLAISKSQLRRRCLAAVAGLPPRAFLGDVAGRCGCGHDHSASFIPFLRGRPGLPRPYPECAFCSSAGAGGGPSVC